MAWAAVTLWLARPSRFARTTRPVARALLGLLALLVAVSFTAVDAPETPVVPVASDGGPARADVLLYERIVEGVRAGGDYYTVAADAQRAGGYPLHPFMTMRLPTLAVVQALLPVPAATALLYALAAVMAAAWWQRLGGLVGSLVPRIVAMALLGCGAMVSLRYDLQAFHEIWAGLLMALSLAIWRPGRWVESVALALCAMTVRETAALYALVMLAAAVLGGQRREALGWALAIGLFGALIALHIHAWSQVALPDDPTGPGWNAMLGAGFVARTIVTETALAALPLVIAAPLVALALAGWAALDDAFGVRVGLTLFAYALFIALFCRADTPYWGLMMTPISLVGLAFVPDALRDLGRAARGSRRVTVTRRIE